MKKTMLRTTSSLGLALCLGLAFLPLACGGTSNPWAGGEPVERPSEGPQVPKETFAAMMGCLADAKGRLTDTVYAMQFDVEVTESGHAGRVKFRDSSPSEPKLEACITDALKGMTSPVPVTMLLPKEKAEGSPVAPASRGLIGQLPAAAAAAAAAGGGVSLGTIFLTALGVTVIVGVVVYVGEEVIEAIKRKRKIDRMCDVLLVECLSYRPQPEWNREIYGDFKDCAGCAGECKKHGRWPDERCPRPGSHLN